MLFFFTFSAEFMKKSLYISKYTTNRPCEAVGVNEANGFLLPIVLLLEIAQIEKDLPGGFVGFVHLVVMQNLPLVIDRSLRLLS